MPNPVLYHNPRCSKSRQALRFVQENNSNIAIVEYLKTPPSVAQLNDLYTALVNNNAIKTVIDMMRIKEPEFAQAGISKASSVDELIQAIADYPKLLERPILHMNNLAAIGRPLANIEALLND